MTRLALAALLAAAPVVAGATSIPASLTGLNDLALGDYVDSANESFLGNFELRFVASDAPRTVTAKLNVTATFGDDANFGFTTGDAFDAPATGVLGQQSLIQTIMFDVLEDVEFQLVFFAGTSVTKDAVYTLDVTSVVTPAPAPVPLPAALPMIAVALGALGLVGRRRKA